MINLSDLGLVRDIKNIGRRAFMASGVGLGAVAATELLSGGKVFGAGAAPPPAAGPDKGLMRTGQIPARAKRVVSIHMVGAISHVDTFEYKPTLIKMHGKDIPPSVKGNGKISSMSNAQTSFLCMKPITEFRQYGESGQWVSDFMPYTAKVVDDLLFVRSLSTPHVNHDPAAFFLHTGFQLSGRPSAGAWVNYALGTDNANLPSYIIMRSQYMAAGVGANSGCWSAGFLPSHHQGVEFRSGIEPVLYVKNPDGMTKEHRRNELDYIGALSRDAYESSGDPEVLSKIAQYEMAYRMQDSTPDVTDISDEPEYILDMYGPTVRTPGTFARNCLLTRRLIERGVKFVQLMQVGWDHHTGIVKRLPVDCWAVDQPAAALITDLKQRGLLDDTLVTFSGEFGRTPYAQGGITETSGRDHHGGNFTMWMAGGGVKAGHSYGESDDFGYNVAKDPVSVHDMHATMLYLMGIDHKALTFHYQGRDFRLTDVEGEVIKGLIA